MSNDVYSFVETDEATFVSLPLEFGRLFVRLVTEVYYEDFPPNPVLDFIERAAAALEVSVAELLGSEPNSAKSKPGPASQLQRKFEQVKLPPREKQKFVLQFLDTVLESNQQKA